MNYPPNTTAWKIGDLVIHDADAKQAEMLMIVLGDSPDGRLCTKYAQANRMNGDLDRRRPQVWQNPPEVLHDPALFGIPTQV